METGHRLYSLSSATLSLNRPPILEIKMTLPFSVITGSSAFECYLNPSSRTIRSENKLNVKSGTYNTCFKVTVF